MDRRRGRIYLWRCACRCAGRVRWLADGNGQTGRHTWQWSSRGGGVLQPARAIHNFLYRSTVPGHPEANRMETAIDMGGHDLRNGGTIRAQTAEFAHSTITVGGAQYYGDSANI